VNVLAVSPFPLLPPTHGGRTRALRVATALAKAGADVDVLAPWTPGQPFRSFLRAGVAVHPHRFPASVLPALLGDRFLSPLLMLSLQPFSFGPRQRLRRLRRPDVVQFHFCAHPSWMERLRDRARIVYFAHNVETDYLLEQPGRMLTWRPFVKRLRALERRAVEASDLVVTCSESDAHRLRALYGPSRFEIVEQLAEAPAGADRAALRAETRRALGLRPEELAVLYVGGPASHSRTAAAFLAHEAVPGLRRPARLLLVGQCAAARRDLDSRVLSLGYLDDLAGVLAAADVGVNPTSQASGASVKVAEYLAAGLPVVATPGGARGFERWADRMTVVPRRRFAAAWTRSNSGRHARVGTLLVSRRQEHVC
jgi:glycosyltransferase involved in cell wall biosynthesis